MKKVISFIVAILIFLDFSLFALPIGGTALIKLSDDFYSEMDLLYLSLGRMVSKTRPYSANEANVYLKAIENVPMRESERKIYKKLRAQVALIDNEDDEQVYHLSTRGVINPEFYFHTNTKFRDDIEYDEKGKPKEEYCKSYSPFYNEFLNAVRQKSFMTIGFDIMVKSNAALHFEFPIANSVHTLKPFGSTNFGNNLPLVSSFTSFDYEDFNCNFPYRAFMSIGNEWWNMVIGREQYDFGSGISGNFLIDEHLPYHNALNLTAFSPNFKMSFLASFFPHPSQYEDVDAPVDPNKIKLKRYFDQNEDAYTGIKLLLDHRLEWINKEATFRVALDEAIIYQNDKGVLDLQIFNPVMLFHNLYVAGNANSILTLEWDYMLKKGVEQKIALVIDDLNIPGEKKHAIEQGNEPKPDAIGLQLGFETATPLSNGFLKSALEVTLTSSALYLRDSNNEKNPYTLNYIVAIRNQRSNHGIYDLTYIGYPYGSNALNCLFSIGYLSVDNWAFDTELVFNIKGPVNLNSRYSIKDGDGYKYPFMKLKEDPLNAYQLSLRSTTSGYYCITKDFDVISSFTFYNVWNMNNDPSSPFEFDFELKVGCKYTF